MNAFQILTSKLVWFDALERFYRPWKIAYFPLKRPVWREKKSSIAVATTKTNDRVLINQAFIPALPIEFID
jgi:hypothetical protein